jgi:flagellar motor switch protein FliM
MRYLLIDFGASNIKSIIYDTINKTFSHQKNIESPFRKVNNISKKDLKILLMNNRKFAGELSHNLSARVRT